MTILIIQKSGPDKEVKNVQALADVIDQARKDDRRLMFTLTKVPFRHFALQFRCWDGLFSSAYRGYVDSNGKNLVFQVSGNSKELSLVVEKLTDGRTKWECEHAYMWT